MLFLATEQLLSAFLGPHAEWFLLADGFLWSSLCGPLLPGKHQGVCSFLAQTFWRWQKRRVKCDVGMRGLQSSKGLTGGLTKLSWSPWCLVLLTAEWFISQVRSSPKPPTSASPHSIWIQKHAEIQGYRQPYHLCDMIWGTPPHRGLTVLIYTRIVVI